MKELRHSHRGHRKNRNVTITMFSQRRRCVMITVQILLHSEVRAAL